MMHLVSILSFNFAILIIPVSFIDYSIMFISTLATAFILERSKEVLNYLGLKKEKLLTSIIFGIFVYFLVFIPLKFFTNSEIFFPHFSDFSPINVVIISIGFLFYALVEDTVYMGYIFNKMSEKNVILAFITAGILHASWHWPFAFLYGQYNYLGIMQNIISFFITFISGIIFLVTKRNIAGPVVFHALSNLIQIKL